MRFNYHNCIAWAPIIMTLFLPRNDQTESGRLKNFDDSFIDKPIAGGTGTGRKKITVGDDEWKKL